MTDSFPTIHYDHETRAVSDAQAARRARNEAVPSHDWDTKRDALVASGLVEERRLLRAEQ